MTTSSTPPFSPETALLPRWRAWLRLGLYLGGVCALAVVLGLHAARAEAHRTLARFGESLFAPLGPRFEGGGHALRLNGMRLEVASMQTDSALETVLDAFEAECVGAAPSWGCETPGETLESATCRSARTREQPADPWRRIVEQPGRLFVLRHSAGEEGHLICLAQPSGRDLEDVVEGVQEFLDTGDLAALGALRYVVARRTRGGTQVRAVWSDGPMRLAELFPRAGDAPGQDIPLVPRPKGVVRVFSADVVDHPQALAAYTGELSLVEWARFYDESLPHVGWERVLGVPERQQGGAVGRAYVRDGRVIAIALRRSARGETLATVVDMGGPSPAMLEGGERAVWK